jgi:hypothetical protein
MPIPNKRYLVMSAPTSSSRHYGQYAMRGEECRGHDRKSLKSLGQAYAP